MFSCVFTWIHVFCLLSRILNEFDTSRTGSDLKNLWFNSKHVSTHQMCSQNPVNSRTETRELSQLNSWIHLQNMWNHGSLFAGLVLSDGSCRIYSTHEPIFPWSSMALKMSLLHVSCISIWASISHISPLSSSPWQVLHLILLHFTQCLWTHHQTLTWNKTHLSDIFFTSPGIDTR